MDVQFVWVFILFSKVLITSNYETNIGHFRVLRRHFGIGKCGNEMLHHDEYVGGRVSNMTGECEGLSHAWGRNQTMELGYGYVKKISVQKSFEPPAVIPQTESGVWTTSIPGILDAGAKIDLHLNGQIEGSQTTFSIWLTDEAGRRPFFTLSIADTSNQIYIGGTSLGFPGTFYSSAEWKISFVAQNRSMQVLVDDTELTTTNLTAVSLNYLTTIKASSNSKIYGNGLFIRRFDFSSHFQD